MRKEGREQVERLGDGGRVKDGGREGDEGREGDGGREGDDEGGRDTEGGEDESVRVATVCFLWLVSMEMEEE